MRSESSNYKLGHLDKVLVLKFVLTRTNQDTKFRGSGNQLCERGNKKKFDGIANFLFLRVGFFCAKWGDKKKGVVTKHLGEDLLKS